MSDIKKRKKDHVELTVTDDTQYNVSPGFDKYYFNHNALPEVSIDEVSTTVQFLGRTFSFPLFISSMTGGYADAGPVNAIIAQFCEKHDLPFGVGSQRAMLEDESLSDTFSVVREHAPNAFICANIGGAQLRGGLHELKVEKLIKSIEANAVIVHLNPLQELMQPEGDRDFTGILNGIEQMVYDSKVPVIVKETGAGISEHVARRLLNAGVEAIDVAGAGGTSWSKVENFRSLNKDPYHSFNEWGIPTADCLEQLSELKWERSFGLIASGGLRSASDIAKALCLGAEMTAMAQPVIKAIDSGGIEALDEYFERLKYEFKMILTLLGCAKVNELSRAHLLTKSGS